MSRAFTLGLTLAIALSVLGLSHVYIWMRLIRDTHPPAAVATLLTLLLVALGLSMPLGMILLRQRELPWARLLTWVSFTWMGAFFVTVSVLGGGDALRGLLGLVRQVAPDLVPSAPWLTAGRSYALISAALSLGLCAVAARNALLGPQTTQVQVRLAHLAPDLGPFRIVQISDLHVAPLLGRPYVERVVQRVQALQPSIVVITGDLIDGSVERLRDGVAPLAQLQAPYGVYFVTGNHEYYSGVDAWIAELQRLGIRVLRNERVAVGPAGKQFDLAGIDDYTAAHFGHGHGANLKGALRGRDPARTLVLLAHQPKAVFEAAELGVDLMLSGHTHGGQIWPFGWVVRLVQPYLRGLHRHGGTQIYVNRGTGYWGPPMRLGSMPEITCLNLLPEASPPAP